MCAWPRPALADISTSIEYGLTASADASLEEPKFLRITDIQNGLVDWDSVPACRCAASDVARYGLQNGDIVFARTGATTGKSFLIKGPPHNAVFASYLIRVRPDVREVDPGFLAYFFDSPDYWRQITKGATGTTQPGVNGTKLKELEIPLPPLPEQKRIAAILDRADAVRRKRQAAIRLTEELLRAAFLEMFGDPVTNSKSWEVRTLGEIASRRRNAMAIGPFGSDLKTTDYRNDGVPVFFVKDIVSGAFVRKSEVFVSEEKAIELSAHVTAPGDVLVTKMGTPPGIAAAHPLDVPRAIVTADLIKISPDETISRAGYLVDAINSLGVQSQVRRITNGVTRAKVTLGDFKLLRVLLPPLAEQRRWIQMRERLVSHTTRHEAGDRSLQEFWTSLTQRAFAGRL